MADNLESRAHSQGPGQGYAYGRIQPSQVSDEIGDDLLVCGSCQKDFPLTKITTFMQHKKFDCDDQPVTPDKKSTALLCQSCPERFGTPWSLLKHAQGVHALRIYQDRSRLAQQELRLAVPLIADARSPTSPTMVSPLSSSRGSPKLPQIIVQDVSTTASPEDGWKPLHIGHASRHVEQVTPVHSGESTTSADVGSRAENTEADTDTATLATDGNTTAEVTCCDNQDCGITMVPVTHEEMKKCCSAVVPKKRKRHMEIKHLTSVARSKLKKYSAGLKRRSQATSGQTPSIYIDLEPNNDLEPNSDSPGKDSHKAINETRSLGNNPSGDARGKQVSQRSVIIQPGSTFSIPVPYSVGSQPLIAFTTHHGSPSADAANSASAAPSTTWCAPPGVMINTSPGGTTQMPITKKLLKQETKRLQTSREGSEGTAGSSWSTSSMDPGSRGKKRRYPTSRPYKCDQCDNAFNQRIHLRKHQSKHTGVKPYKCEQCDYSTVERSHLKVHIRVHTGEKPFGCTYCEYATAQNSTLKIHLKRHHNRSGVHTCDTCGQSFTEEGTLQSHTQEHSGPGTSHRSRSDIEPGTSLQEVVTVAAPPGGATGPRQAVPLGMATRLPQGAGTSLAPSVAHKSPEVAPRDAIHQGQAAPGNTSLRHSPEHTTAAGSDCSPTSSDVTMVTDAKNINKQASR